MQSEWQVIVLILLVMLSAYFSASETALTSLNKFKLRSLKERGNRKAGLISRLLEDPARLLSTILIGNNLVNIGASTLATALFVKRFGDAGLIWATAVMTVLVLIFGEVTPKTLANQYPLKVSMAVAPALNALSKLFYPLAFLLTRLTAFMTRHLGARSEGAITQEEIQTVLHVGHEQGVIADDQRYIINNLFGFADTQVKNIMTSRTKVIAMPKEATVGEVLQCYRQYFFSRIPVYDEDPTDFTGVLNVKDLLIMSPLDENQTIASMVRPPLFTYEFVKISRVFQEMKRTQNHMAVVLDEYGTTQGVVSLEDLLEELVGDLEDEYDKPLEVGVDAKGQVLLEGATKIIDFNRMFHTHLESQDFDSMSGYLLGSMDKFPEVGDVIPGPHMTFTVLETDGHFLDRIGIVFDEAYYQNLPKKYLRVTPKKAKGGAPSR